MKINTTGLIDNLQGLSGALIGLCILKPLGLRFGKEHRGQHKLFSHVAANVAAELGTIRYSMPYRVIMK